MSFKRSWSPVVAIATALALAVSGCGDDDDSSSSSAGSGSSTASSEAPAAGSTAAPSTTEAAGDGTIDVGVGKITPQKDKKKIALFLQATNAYSYPVAQGDAAKAAGEELGYDVDIFYSNLDPATELQNYNSAMTGGKYAGIVFQPVNSQLCTPMKTQPVKNNVLVGVIGNALCDDGTSVGEGLWSPGTAFYVGGANAVDGITSVLETAAKDNPGPQKIALIMGVKGHPSINAWETAYKKFAADQPDWDLVTTVYTDFTTPGAFKSTQDVLQGNSDITMMFGPYIDVGVGVTKAIDAAGKTGKIKYYENGGGSKVAKKLVEQGKITGDLPVYPADNARVGIELMAKAIEGTQPPKYTGGDGNPDFSATGVLTKDNVASFTPQW